MIIIYTYISCKKLEVISNIHVIQRYVLKYKHFPNHPLASLSHFLGMVHTSKSSYVDNFHASMIRVETINNQTNINISNTREDDIYISRTISATTDIEMY